MELEVSVAVGSTNMSRLRRWIAATDKIGSMNFNCWLCFSAS
jgi:hypothetical protein